MLAFLRNDQNQPEVQQQQLDGQPSQSQMMQFNI
jgi:hypothetical protein